MTRGVAPDPREFDRTETTTAAAKTSIEPKINDRSLGIEELLSSAMTITRVNRRALQAL